MKLTKSDRQEGAFNLSVGLFEASVDLLNPTKAELAKYLGSEENADTKEYEYVGEDKDSNTRVTLSFWVTDVVTGKHFNYRLMITDKPMVSEKSGKKQYVSALGMSTWVDDEKNLPEWFVSLKNKDKEKIADVEYRAAKAGEADVYEFLRNLLSKVNWYGVDTNILLDTKKLFRGNVNELKDLLNAPEEENLTGTVIFPATVYITEKDGEKKMYQNLAKYYLPGYQMKKVRLSCAQNSWDADKVTKRFKDNIMGEYGIKDAFTMNLLEDFDENKHLNATDNVLSVSTDEVSDTDY